MDSSIIFQIPIYVRTIEDHSAQMETNRGEFALLGCEAVFIEKLEYTWMFNEVIGWITLDVHDGKIVGNLWMDIAKRKRKGLRWKKIMPLMGSSIQTTVSDSMTSKQIFNRVLSALAEFQERPHIKKWHVDVSTFKMIGQYVDWRVLVHENGALKKNKQ